MDMVVFFITLFATLVVLMGLLYLVLIILYTFAVRYNYSFRDTMGRIIVVKAHYLEDARTQLKRYNYPLVETDDKSIGRYGL